MKEAMNAKKSVLMKLISMMDDESSEKLKPEGAAIEVMKIEGKPMKSKMMMDEEPTEEYEDMESSEEPSEESSESEEEDDEDMPDFSMLEHLRKKYKKD